MLKEELDSRCLKNIKKHSRGRNWLRRGCGSKSSESLTPNNVKSGNININADNNNLMAA